MNYDNQNIILNNIFNIVGEYGVYIFVCLTFGFGTLIYYLSIKNPNPLYESPKLSKRKPKKEKQLRSKIVKNVPVKISLTKDQEKIELKKPMDIIEVSRELLDDEDTTWLPVVKPKKNPKPPKVPVVVTPPISDCPKKEVTSVNVQTVSAINVNEKPKPSVKYESKSTVIEHICDSVGSTFKPAETNQIVDGKIEKPSENIFPIENDQNTIIEDSRKETDSRSNSLSDDFELVDSYKTSSEDGLKPEQYILRIALPLKNSSTSGASRKKTKKQQKMISKQLIEAAEPIEEEENKTKSVVPVSEFKLNPPPVSSEVSRKKRPRKDH